MEIARSTNITFYDAIYLQTAEELNIALVTDDQTQITAGKGIAKVIVLQESKL
jgi:predicted nucleic acid-binding protein